MRKHWTTTDSLLAIRFDDIQVRRPLLAWLVRSGTYVLRTLQTDHGGTPRLRYYLVDYGNGGGAGYEISAIGAWLGL